jgi:hypothetical protein
VNSISEVTDQRAVPRFLKEAFVIARKTGWRVFKGRGHMKWYPPGDGEFVVVSCTRSGPHEIRNCMAELRRHGLDLPGRGQERGRGHGAGRGMA